MWLRLVCGRGREKGELSVANWRLVYMPTWVKNEAVGWHKVRSWSWDTLEKPGPRGLQPQSKGRQGKPCPLARGNVKADIHLHRRFGFFFFRSPQKKSKSQGFSSCEVGPNVHGLWGPTTLTWEINSISAQQMTGLEGPEQEQVQLFWVKLLTQAAGSSQEKGVL